MLMWIRTEEKINDKYKKDLSLGSEMLTFHPFV